MEMTSWHHLPYPGGILEQPDWLIEDLLTISWRKDILENLPKTSELGQPGVMLVRNRGT